MKKLYFLPKWCIERQEANKIKILKAIIAIFFIIDIILMNMYLLNANKTNIIEKQINQLTGIQKNISRNTIKVKNNKTENTFCILYKEILMNTDFQSVSIAGSDIIMNLNPKITEYNSFIDNIERNNKFTIKQISSLNDSQGNLYYNINLMLK